jgi:hypothetical protein
MNPYLLCPTGMHNGPSEEGSEEISEDDLRRLLRSAETVLVTALDNMINEEDIKKFEDWDDLQKFIMSKSEIIRKVTNFDTVQEMIVCLRKESSQETLDMFFRNTHLNTQAVMERVQQQVNEQQQIQVKTLDKTFVILLLENIRQKWVGIPETPQIFGTRA